MQVGAFDQEKALEGKGPRETSFEALLRGIRGNIQNYWVCSTDVCDPLPVSSPRQTEDDLKVKS